MMSLDSDASYRKILRMSISAICLKAGFHSADDIVMKVLVEMLDGFLNELGRSSKQMTELAGRTEPLPSDVWLGLIEMGISTEKLAYEIQQCSSNVHGSLVIPPPKNIPQPPPAKALKIGKSKSHPSYIPEHLPPFPDPHTYIRNEITADPEPTYESVRDTMANQQRSVEVSLVGFLQKMFPNHQLFPGIDNCSLIIPEKEARPYLSALIPDDMDISRGAKEKPSHAVENAYLKPPTMPQTPLEDID